MGQTDKPDEPLFFGYNQELNDDISWTSDYVTIDSTAGGESFGDFYIGDYPPLQELDSAGNPIYPIGGTSGGILTMPNTGTASSPFSIGYAPQKYSVMDLPRDDMPIKVFVAGRMLTIGMLGSDVDAAFIGDQLIFSPGVLNAISYDGRISISLEYKNEIYHYNLNTPQCISGSSTTISVTLLSVIQK